MESVRSCDTERIRTLMIKSDEIKMKMMQNKKYKDRLNALVDSARSRGVSEA
jgi:hypothetical protein